MYIGCGGIYRCEIWCLNSYMQSPTISIWDFAFSDNIVEQIFAWWKEITCKKPPTTTEILCFFTVVVALASAISHSKPKGFAPLYKLWVVKL